MAKPKGGRGKKAEYPTCTIRVPQGITSTISNISVLYQETGINLLEVLLVNLQICRSESKETRNWTELNKLLEAIDSELPANYLSQVSQSIVPSLSGTSKPVEH